MIPRCTPRNADLVFRAIEDETGVPKNEIKGPGKWSSVWLARKMAALVMREVLGGSYPEIGRMIGKDHKSAINAIRAARVALERSEEAVTLYDRIAERVRFGIGDT